MPNIATARARRSMHIDKTTHPERLPTTTRPKSRLATENV